MSSSNQVRLAVITETAYGETPVAGDFKTARFINEALSGTPTTVESQQIRTDRMSSGQVVTGLEVGGEMGFELAKEAMLEDFMLSAMHQASWNTLSIVNRDMTFDVSSRTLTAVTGSFISDGLVKGDFITLGGFVATTNNVPVMVTDVAALILTLAIPEGMVDETGSGTSYKRADKVSIGVTKKSFAIEKSFQDLTTKAIIYNGMIVSEMSLNVNYGELINGSFTFQGNGHVFADSAGEFITNARTVTAPATTNTFNGSIDMPFLASEALGVLGAAAFDIQGVQISLNNNLNPQNVIGESAPVDYSSGTARIEVSLSAYLTDAAWATLPKKLTQESFALGFMVKNAGGWYGFYLPAIQVSFDDPASPGQDQDILLEMDGQAKVGSSGESALTIYKSA